MTTSVLNCLIYYILHEGCCDLNFRRCVDPTGVLFEECNYFDACYFTYIYIGHIMLITYLLIIGFLLLFLLVLHYSFLSLSTF